MNFEIRPMEKSHKSVFLSSLSVIEGDHRGAA